MAEVTFDYQNLLEVEGGLESRELDEIRSRLREAVDELLESSPGFMRLPKTGEYAEVSAKVAEEIRGSGATDFIHVGIGGSALGPMALHRVLNHPYYNAIADHRAPRIHFAENTDPNTLGAILDVADPDGTWVNVVTKSGSTAETMANFLVIRGFLVDSLGSSGYRRTSAAVSRSSPRSGCCLRPSQVWTSRPFSLGLPNAWTKSKSKEQSTRRSSERRCTTSWTLRGDATSGS